jgi:Phage integrase, N-terminal SAM-like domain
MRSGSGANIAHHRMRHPSELGAEHISQFVSSLATDRHVSESTQNQALSAVLFLYRVVLSKDIGSIATDSDGREFQATGTDPNSLLQRAREYAYELLSVDRRKSL